MKVDTIKLITTALYAFSKNGRPIISWTDLMNYTDMLSEIYDINIGFTYNNLTDMDSYDKCVICFIKDGEIYFSLNPNVNSNDIDAKLISKSLLLNDIRIKRLIKKSNQLDLVDAYQYALEETRLKLKKEYMEFKTDKKIFVTFKSIFDIFFQQYSKRCKTISISNFFEFYNSIVKFLNHKNIYVCNCGNLKLELFRNIKNSNFKLIDKHIIIDENNIDIKPNETNDFILNVVNYHLVCSSQKGLDKGLQKIKKTTK